jgi:hypothetical protein
VGRKVLQTKKNSPHIFFGAGLISMTVSTVLACRATLKLHPTLDEINEDLESARHKARSEGTNRELAMVYLRASGKLGRLYAPAAIFGVVGVGALSGSHVQLSRRNTALTAAYAGLAKAFDEYKARVSEEVGEQKELDIRHDLERVKGQLPVGNPLGLSQYARFFDESNVNWEKDPETNRMFLECQVRYVNHRLQSRGHVFLNEVYDALGFEHSREGAVVGWVWQGEGDDYITFGLHEARNSRFLNGTERSVILDFNVDGIIYDKI